MEKFEFIPWDFSFFKRDLDEVDKKYNEFMTRILSIPEFKKRRDQILLAYINNENNLVEDLAYYDTIAGETKRALYRDTKKNDSNLEARKRITEVRSYISFNISKLKKLLAEPADY